MYWSNTLTWLVSYPVSRNKSKDQPSDISCFFVSACWSTCTAAVGCVLWLVLRPRYVTKHTNAWYIATRLHWSCDLWSWSCEHEIRLEIMCHTTRSCELRGLPKTREPEYKTVITATQGVCHVCLCGTCWDQKCENDHRKLCTDTLGHRLWIIIILTAVVRG